MKTLAIQKMSDVTLKGQEENKAKKSAGGKNKQANKTKPLKWNKNNIKQKPTHIVFTIFM